MNRVTYNPPPSTLGAFGATLYSGDPMVTGTTEKNANWKDTQTFRVALKWQPIDGLSIDPSLYVQTLHINDTGAYWLNISNPANNIYNNGNAQRDPSTDPWYLGAIKVSWNQPWANIVSNTSYFSRQQHSVSDYSQWFDTVFFYNQYPPAGEINSSYFTDHQNNFNEEIRASSVDSNAPLQWTAGLFYTHTNEDSTEYVVSEAACAGNTCPISRTGTSCGRRDLSAAALFHARQASRHIRRSELEVHRCIEVHSGAPLLGSSILRRGAGGRARAVRQAQREHTELRQLETADTALRVQLSADTSTI